jgi:hypothetical protein
MMAMEICAACGMLVLLLLLLLLSVLSVLFPLVVGDGMAAVTVSVGLGVA